MIIKVYFAIIFSLFVSISFAQYDDDMEAYVVGEPVDAFFWNHGGCGGGPGCDLMSSDAYAYSGIKSGWVPGDGTTIVGLDLDNRVFGNIHSSFYMYIPDGNEAVFQIVDYFPVENSQPIMGNFYFNKHGENPGIGFIDDCPNAPVFFNFPHDQWFKVEFFVDIYTNIEFALFEIKVNNIDVIPFPTPLTNNAGESPNAVGGYKFLSNSSISDYYLDDAEFWDSIINSIDDKNKARFILYPNPTVDKISIQTEINDFEIQILTAMGQVLFQENSKKEIDVSFLPRGIYFMVMSSKEATGTEKFIKN